MLPELDRLREIRGFFSFDWFSAGSLPSFGGTEKTDAIPNGQYIAQAALLVPEL